MFVLESCGRILGTLYGIRSFPAYSIIEAFICSFVGRWLILLVMRSDNIGSVSIKSLINLVKFFWSNLTCCCWPRVDFSSYANCFFKIVFYLLFIIGVWSIFRPPAPASRIVAPSLVTKKAIAPSISTTLSVFRQRFFFRK